MMPNFLIFSAHVDSFSLVGAHISPSLTKSKEALPNARKRLSFWMTTYKVKFLYGLYFLFELYKMRMTTV